MSRLDRAAIIASLGERIGAVPDPEQQADLTASRGKIAVVAAPGEIDAALGRLKPLPGYRWIAINGGDAGAMLHTVPGQELRIHLDAP